MPRLVQVSATAAAKRRVYFQVVQTDGITPATGEAGGQPQISTNGAAWTSTGIGTLTHVGNGRYYADLTAGAVATAGDWIETRYKSANTAEIPGDSAWVVDFDLSASGSLEVTLTSPVTQSGAVEIYKGDSYAAVDGRELAWSSTDWPTLAGSTIAFEVHGVVGDFESALTTNGTVTAFSPTSPQAVRVELTALETAALERGTYEYEVVATLTTNGVVTLARGTFRVKGE